MNNTKQIIPNFFVHDKNIQLREAVSRGDHQLVKKLLTVDKLNVNSTLDEQDANMCEAIIQNDLLMVKLLLRFRANLNPSLARSSEIHVHSPLWLAMLLSYDDIFEILVRFGADVNENHNPPCKCIDYFNYGGRNVLLHQAVVTNREAKVKILLDYGADVNKLDKESETALHCAVGYEYISIARLLILRGANIEALGLDGMTPFHSALITGNSKVVQLMIDAGCNVRAVDNNGKNALHFLAEAKEENVLLAEILINMGVSMYEAESTCGVIPLHVALLAGKNKLARFFVESGSDVNTRIFGGAHSLSLAVICCKPETLRYLVSKGAAINARNDAGETALHRAARFESPSKLELLLQLGADVNIKDVQGNTVLNWIKNKSSRAAKVLIKHLARMKVDNAFIDSSLLQIISDHEILRINFQQYCEENVLMQETQFYPNYTLRNLLDESDGRLALLVRNKFFVRMFESINFQTMLPTYRKQVIRKFRKAEEARNLFFSIEKYINLLFCYALPSLVVQEIVRYLQYEDLPNLTAYMIHEYSKVTQNFIE